MWDKKGGRMTQFDFTEKIIYNSVVRGGSNKRQGTENVSKII